MTTATAASPWIFGSTTKPDLSRDLPLIWNDSLTRVLSSPSSKMRPKIILPISGTTSLREWTVSVKRQAVKFNLNFKSHLLKLSHPHQCIAMYFLSSCQNFLRRQPLVWRRPSQCARASRSTSAQRWELILIVWGPVEWVGDQFRVWHSWKFWYKWMSEYIRINKITRMNIRIYSH